MNESWMSRVTKVERGEIEEVENQDELGQVEARPDKEHDECKLEEIIKDKMTPNGSSSVDKFSIG